MRWEGASIKGRKNAGNPHRLFSVTYVPIGGSVANRQYQNNKKTRPLRTSFKGTRGTARVLFREKFDHPSTFKLHIYFQLVPGVGVEPTLP